MWWIHCGCSSEYRETSTEAGQLPSLLPAAVSHFLSLGSGLGRKTEEEWKKHGFILLFCIPRPTGKQLLEAAENLHKAGTPSPRLCCTISPALGLAPGGAVCHRPMSPSSSCPPSSMFMLKTLASNRCTAAVKQALFWRLTNLTYLAWGLSGDTVGDKKHPKVTVQSRRTVANKYPCAYVAMVHTVRNTAHKHNQADKGGSTPPSLPAGFPGLNYILLVHPNIRSFKKGKSLSFRKRTLPLWFARLRNAPCGSAAAAERHSRRKCSEGTDVQQHRNI